MRNLLLHPLLMCILAFNYSFGQTELPSASWDKLPRWRGFNLCDKFMRDSKPTAFREEDFQLISKWGFNFVRLPMDYRVWILDGDWTQFDEGVLKEIDQAVGWGKKYGVHVCINFHRAPGYTVAKPSEKLSVFTSEEALRICTLHWATFARRYKGIPSSRLSFNLFNEPANISEENYVRVVAHLVKAIRAEDPERLIICDGIDWGSKPVHGLVALQVAQATRGYQPMSVSHYKASWIGASSFSEPRWPVQGISPYFYGPGQKKLFGMLTMGRPWKRGDKVILHVDTVSGEVVLSMKADEKEFWSKVFLAGEGAGEWKKSVFNTEWEIYQNVYDKDYEVILPEDCHRLSVLVSKGDWLSISEMKIVCGDSKTTINTMGGWGQKQSLLKWDESAGIGKGAWIGLWGIDKEYLWRESILPWINLEGKGAGVLVGEFGAYNKTPHAVTLSWMRDCLENWKQAGWGWALWNFRGSFGVLDSGRDDVSYETIGSHRLDRKMLELLQQY